MSWETLLYCGRRTNIGSDGTEYWTCWKQNYVVRIEGVGLNRRPVVSYVVWHNGYREEVKYSS